MCIFHLPETVKGFFDVVFQIILRGNLVEHQGQRTSTRKDNSQRAVELALEVNSEPAQSKACSQSHQNEKLEGGLVKLPKTCQLRNRRLLRFRKACQQVS